MKVSFWSLTSALVLSFVLAALAHAQDWVHTGTNLGQARIRMAGEHTPRGRARARAEVEDPARVNAFRRRRDALLQLVVRRDLRVDQLGVRVRVEVELANYEDMILAENGHLAEEKVRRTRIPAVVDSGAVRLVLPQRVVDELGLIKIGSVNVRYADQRRARRAKVRDVWLKLLDRDEIFSAIVEPKRDTALIGAIVLEDLDFVVDCTKGRLVPRDPDYVVSEAE